MAKAMKYPRATAHHGDNREGIMIYRGTAVAKWDAGRIVLDTGGWRGFTTKERMNQASEFYGLGFRVYQKNYEWFAVFGDTVYEFTDRTLTLERRAAPVRHG